MAQPNSNSVKVVEVCRVDPQPCSPDSPIPDHFSLPLTFFDIHWLRLKPIQRVFFYETSSIDTIIPKLKTSLSLTLQHFLPLAGTLTWPKDSYKPILNYVQGDTVSLTIAESEADFHQLSSNEYLQAKEYHPLVPQLAVTSEHAAVLVLQITVFPNHGISIGTSMHHAVVDGKSSTMFFKSWAHICKHGSAVSLPDQLKPCYSDRQAIKDPKGIETIYSNDWLSSGGPNNRSLMFRETKFSPGTIRGTFEFTQANIETLRRLVKTAMGSDSAHLSSFSLTCGYTWACLVKAEEEEIKSDQVRIVFSVDCRSRLDPPVSAAYFGNCIVGHLAVAETKGLLGEDGLVVAVKAISETIKALDVSGGLLNGAETWVSKMCSAKGTDRLYSVAGSRIFEIYDTNFGWGRPKRTEVVSIDMTGAISFSDSRNGGRGVEVGLVLNEPNMQVFASLFAKSLADLG
uniref:phenolic glucoside malonyltransferase 1-like n=1 Tax=Fragaria vesca subsp. vesca TaxID=101020 RepID=UPI0005CAB9F0|nr:PREDICTED: phenolic glucoside malonyltransferase 1-like [Fragaria vesca subsp. vesca]